MEGHPNHLAETIKVKSQTVAENEERQRCLHMHFGYSCVDFEFAQTGLEKCFKPEGPPLNLDLFLLEYIDVKLFTSHYNIASVYFLN